MTLQLLQAHLEQTFDPVAAGGMDAVLRLAIADESLTFSVSGNRLQFHDSPDTTADATFYFQDLDIAWALLSGRADAFKAFMDGGFRADGYLMWAFALMSMFQSNSLPDTPIE